MLAIFLLAGLVSAPEPTPAVQTNSEQTYTGTNNVIVTFANQGNVTGVELYYRTSSTASWTRVSSNQTSHNLTSYTLNWNTVTAGDSYSGQINATARNRTMTTGQANISSAVVNINLDNEAPNLTYTLSKTKVDSDSTVRYTCTIDAESGSNNTNLITMYRPDNSTFTSSELENVLRFGSVGRYSTNCQVTDGQGQIKNTEFQTITVSSGADNYVIITPKGSADSGVTSVAKERSKLTAVWIIALIVVVAVILILYVVTQQGKKKRRR